MKKLILCAAFLFLITAASFAVDYQTLIYIRNEPYTGKYIIKNNDIYIPVHALLNKLHYDWNQKGNDVYILDYRLDKPSSKVTAGNITYHLDDGAFTVDSFTKDGYIYVNSREFGRKMDAYVMYNADTNIYDIVMPEINAAQVIAGVAGTAGGSAAAGGTGSDGKDPITATVESFDNYNPEDHGATGGEVRGTVTVTNTGSKEVPDVVATLRIQDMSGGDLHTETFAIGTMTGGQVVKKEFYWPNPNPLLSTQSKVDIEHGEIKEDKKEGAPVEGQTQGQNPNVTVTDQTAPASPAGY